MPKTADSGTLAGADVTESVPFGPVEIFLHPGQSYVATQPAILKMILGSCVGVFLFDPLAAIGAACHFMLPRSAEGVTSPRYGEVAVPDLIQKAIASGCARFRLQARVFGGASMLGAWRGLHGNSIGLIGERNVAIAVELLAKASIPIVAKNVFGEQGRKVAMISDTGENLHEFVSNAGAMR